MAWSPALQLFKVLFSHSRASVIGQRKRSSLVVATRFSCRWFNRNSIPMDPLVRTLSTPSADQTSDSCIGSGTAMHGTKEEKEEDGCDQEQLPSPSDVTSPPKSNATPTATHDLARYSYASRGFTSEVFKLEVVNLPPHVGFRQLKNRLKSLKLNPVKIKIAKELCFVTFKNEEDKKEAMTILNGHVWKKRELRALPAHPSTDPIIKRKRKAATLPASSESKRICASEDAEPPKDINERLAEAITPFLHVSYQEQLARKSKSMEDFLVKVAQSILKLNPGDWFNSHVSSHNGLFCQLDLIRPSPVLTEYRNKCEFTIGLGPQNETAVGFRLGAYKDGDLTVAPPNSVIVPEKTKKIVEVVQQFVSESSLKPFDCRTVDGHWKQLTVRHFTSGDTMVIIQFHPQQLSQEIILKEKEALIDAFNKATPASVPASLYWQTLNDRTAGKERTSYELLSGAEFVYEELLGVRFRVSPDAFFQVNSKAAEVLYSTIGELIAADATVKEEPPIIYDLCCGTGTIGITLSKNIELSKVIGIELSDQAVADAIHNSTANGLTNADFICGKVEDTLSSLTIKRSTPGSQATEAATIAIADPPRGGLHPRVIQSIRKCSSIQTLIYVACNPEGALNNYIDLCRPQSNRLKGQPFCPVKAVPVDMFPHTRHCELVIVFKRRVRTTSTATTATTATTTATTTTTTSTANSNKKEEAECNSNPHTEDPPIQQTVKDTERVH